MAEVINPVQEFLDSDEARAMDEGTYLKEYRRLLDEQKASQETQNEPVEDGSVIVSDEELLKRSNRKGILKDVPIENPLEKRILSGFRLPEDDNDPYFHGLRGSEISDMRKMQRRVLGEEEINPNEEEAARALASGILTTLDSVAGIPDIPARLRGEQVPLRFSEAFDIKPIELDTKWGPFLESTVHYGSLGIGVMGAIAASPFSLPTLGGGSTFLSKFGTGILQGSIIGVGQDAVSYRSFEQNASRMIIDEFPAFESVLGPLATKDSDSPSTIYLKNIFEGIGFEAGLGATWELLGQGLSKAKRATLKNKVKNSALTKLEDRFNQARNKGQAEFDEQNEFLRTISDLEQRQLGGEVIDMDNLPPSPYLGVRGHKNAPTTDSWQGSPLSRSSPYDNWSNLNKIDVEEPYGSVDSILTTLDYENLATNGIDKGLLNRLRRRLVDDDRFQEILKRAKAKGTSTYAAFRKSFDRYGEITGLNFKNPKADWEAYLKRTGLTTSDIFNYESIINSTFKTVRDLATAAKEVKRIGGDVFSVDGPMKAIADRLVTGFDLLNYNRLISRSNVKNADKALFSLHKESLEGVDLLMNFLDREAPEELIDQVLKFLSTSHRSGKMADFNNWMRQKMTGGDMLPGRNKQGALLDELHQIHINSFFGPKTAQRALWGTGFNSYLNQFNDVLGAGLRYPFTRDSKQFKSQFASLMSMIDFIPDAFKIFKGNLGEAFKKGADIDTRFTEYGRRHNIDKSYEEWLEFEGSEGDKIVWNLWKVAHNLNGDTNLGRFASGISRVMDAGDKTFNELIRHKRVKEIAMRDALIAKEKGDIIDITEDVLDHASQLYEQKFYNEYGDLDLTKEGFTNNEFLEVTYRSELEGPAKAFTQFIEQIPVIKPFYRFVRSGVNGLKVKTQNMPILAAMLKKERDIFFARPGDFSTVRRYGIENDWDLERMKGRQVARQAMGMGLVYVAAQKWLSSGLWGNGPNNQGMRNLFRDTGGEANTIEIGGKRVSLDLFEPFDLLLKGVVDVGENMALMGPEWAEGKLQAFAIATAFSEAATDETFLSAVGDLVDMMRGKPGAGNRMVSNLAHFVPLGGWRRWAGQALTDSYREINSSIWNERGLLESGPIQAIRKDNLLTEAIAKEPLALKYNILNGKPFKETSVLGRLWRATSMVAIEPGASPGQKLLWNSNYDLRVSTWNSPAPDSISLKDSAFLRSEFQKQIGLSKINGLNLEDWLNKMAKDPRIIASVNEMIADRKSGVYDLNPMKAYYHNKVIKKRFELHRSLAWNRVRQLPEASELIRDKLELQQRERLKLRKTTLQDLPILPNR